MLDVVGDEGVGGEIGGGAVWMIRELAEAIPNESSPNRLLQILHLPPLIKRSFAFFPFKFILWLRS